MICFVENPHIVNELYVVSEKIVMNYYIYKSFVFSLTIRYNDYKINRGQKKMEFILEPILKEDVANFKKDMQEAFQQGAVKEFPGLDAIVLPEKDIDESLSKKGAVAHKAIVDGKMSGGAIVIIDESTQHNHLDFLYVRCGIQSKGIGQKIWIEIEKLYPQTKVWETCTPYFEKRNVHFYINCLGFHAVEFFNPWHKDTNIPDDMIGGDYFFRFEKLIKH